MDSDKVIRLGRCSTLQRRGTVLIYQISRQPIHANPEKRHGTKCYRLGKPQVCEYRTHRATGAPLRPGSNHVGRLWSSSVRDLTQNRFTSTKSFLNTAPELHESLRSKLNIPQFFFDRMYLQSNGFSGYDIWLNQNEEVESYGK